MATVSRMGAFPLRKRARWTLKNDDSYTLEAQNRAGRPPPPFPVLHSTVRFAPSPLSRRSPGGLVFWFSLVRNTSPPPLGGDGGQAAGESGLAGWLVGHGEQAEGIGWLAG